MTFDLESYLLGIIVGASAVSAFQSVAFKKAWRRFWNDE